MTDFALAPATPNVTLREDTRAMLEAGELRAYRVRGNGTMRHVTLYPLGSTGRDTAEWISEQMNDRVSVAKMARELHVSTAAVRRILLGLELTEEIEAGDWDGVLTSTGLYADNAVVELRDEVAPEAKAEAGNGVEVTVPDRSTVSSTPKMRPGDLHYRAGQFSGQQATEQRVAEVEANLRRVGAPEPERTAQVALRKPRSHG